MLQHICYLTLLIRNNIRHYFVESPAVKLCYDIVTWMATQAAISYTVVPFVLLSVKPSLTFYRIIFQGAGKKNQAKTKPKDTSEITICP
uniref:Uncharacterized protein n=1 Tax=Cyanistes caeruleus TaxID=156563 RepID=A0A8C0VGB5_CYACU